MSVYTTGMMTKKPSPVLTALDIGTTKIVALIAQFNEASQVEILGMGTHPSEGLKRGVVVNIESTTQSIAKAIEMAEVAAGQAVKSVYAGIAGSHIRSTNSHGVVAIRNQEVTASDIDRVIDAAQAVAIPADQRVLHILPREFVIDSQDSIHEPIGMSGVRLEAKVHIITGAVSAAQNIVKCVELAGVGCDDVILEQLASSYAVLSEDEKELGVCLIDIGGGTADIAVFVDGAICHSAVIPIAGDQVTNDVAIALRTPTRFAGQLKDEFGCAIPEMANEKTLIEVPSVADRPAKHVSQRALAEIIGARYEELFELVAKELERSGYADLIASGMVLTGGASKVRGAVELAEHIFDLPVRLGAPKHVQAANDSLEDPRYATAVGLLKYGYIQESQPKVVATQQTGVSEMFARMKHWFRQNF